MDATTEMYGTGSKPRTAASPMIRATTMGGTVEKLEFGMTGIYSGCRPAPCSRAEPDEKKSLNKTLGQNNSALPSRTRTWREPTKLLESQGEAPCRGGMLDPKKGLTSKPYTPYSIIPRNVQCLKTKNHTSSCYHGMVFSIRAEHRPLRIMALHAAAGLSPRRELYRIYIKDGQLSKNFLVPSEWREVAAGEAELPVAPNMYGQIPCTRDGIKVQAGQYVSILVHCPYNKYGIAFRSFAKSWPGYPALTAPTDGNKDLTVMVGRATYSQTPFESLSKVGVAFAGVIEYEFLDDLSNPTPSDFGLITTQK